MRRPKCLDLFCGAGGAAMGLHRAGFDVVGVDIKPQPRYPFTFVRGDALKPPFRLADFDLVWASPPCQRFCVGVPADRRASHPDLIQKTRALLQSEASMWIIENVPGAPIRADFILCGCVVGLPRIKRRRHFECSWRPLGVRPQCHGHYQVVTVTGNGTTSGNRATLGRNVPAREMREVMGIGWMDRKSLSQAIPPAYSEHIGHYAMAALGR